MDSFAVLNVSHRFHGFHRFNTDDSFVKHHCSTDCSALAEEFHGTVMKKQIKQYCTYQTDVKIVNKRLSQSKICDSLCCFLT